MSNVYFCSDHHFGHSKILKFSGDLREGNTVDEHDKILIDKHNSIINKRDLVYFCGDLCMNPDKYEDYMSRLNGRKILVRGNHDKYPAREYLNYFEDIRGTHTYKGYWVSHVPMHPVELRGRSNIHGHVHSNTILLPDGTMDKRYINVCMEANNGYPVRFDSIKNNEYNRLC